MINLKACGTALVTPFRDGRVDYDAYAALVDRQAAAGVDFLAPLATTGETPALSKEEKTRLMQVTREHFNGPLLVGCGSNAVGPTLENIEFVSRFDPEALLVIVPFYNKPTQEGQYLYFKEIASHTDKPIVIYNVPSRTGANMEAATCIRLACEIPNIIGIKEATGRLLQAEAIAKGCPASFSVLSGDDYLTIEMMKAGGKGVVSVASNIAPVEVSAMVHAAVEGRMDEAEALNARLQPLFKNCFIESNPIPVKAGLAAMGLCSPEMRLPLSEATAETKIIMSETIDKLWK